MKKLITFFCLSGFGVIAQNPSNTSMNQQNRVNEVIASFPKPEIINNSQVLNVGESNGFVTPVMIQPNGSQFIDSKIYFQKVGQGQMPLFNSIGKSKIGFNSYEYMGEFIIVELGGLYGVLDKFGEKILPTTYKEIKLPSSFKGLFAVKKGNKWGYVNISNKVILPFKFDEASAFDTNNIAVLSENGKESQINEKGEFLK